jgi:hypothetical protein
MCDAKLQQEERYFEVGIMNTVPQGEFVVFIVAVDVYSTTADVDRFLLPAQEIRLDIPLAQNVLI